MIFRIVKLLSCYCGSWISAILRKLDFRMSGEQRGFSLLETLVAVLILSLLLSGSMALVQQALQISSKLKNDTTALYLAQEGLELIKYQRDTNRLSDPDPDKWLENITKVVGQPCHSTKCIPRIDVTGGDFELDPCVGPCQSTGGLSYLRFNTISKIYAHQIGANWVITPYRRLIEIDCTGACVSTNEIRVRVTVDWKTTFGTRSYVVEENLLNWQ